ncbi:MAG: two-component sensor histidine kinase [Firmicutes bacterium]|nr:two-component sensor histidine kinase [Bacillota bacterium]
MRWLTYLHNRTNIFTKVLVANALIVVTGSLLAVAIFTYAWRGQTPSPSVELLLVLVGLASSLGVNYGILRVAFQPLFTMHATLDRVRQGDFSARVPDVGGDPDTARVIETANLMLDRLAEHRQAVAAQILRAMEEERKRIARELHDETSQSLTSMVVNLQVIEQQMGGQPEELSGRVRLTKEVAQRTLDETRRLMFDLRPSVLDDLGLVPALRWFISQRVQPMGLTVEFQPAGLDHRLSDELETAFFRIMQEAITNTVKHARATHVTITLAKEGGAIVGSVQDDGSGFHPMRVRKDEVGRGLGLFGMHERAALVGGSVDIDSAPGRGTTVRVTVPDRVRGNEAGG